MRNENKSKITRNVAKSPKFQSFHMKSTLMKKKVSDSGPEVEISLILRMPKEKS